MWLGGGAMRSEYVDQIRLNRDRLKDGIAKLRDDLEKLVDENGNTFDLNFPVPGSEVTTNDIIFHVSYICDFLNESSEEKPWNTIPIFYIKDFQVRLFSLADAILELHAQLQPIWDTHKGLSKIFYDSNFIFTTVDGREHQGLAPIFAKIVKQLKELFQHSAHIERFISGRLFDRADASTLAAARAFAEECEQRLVHIETDMNMVERKRQGLDQIVKDAKKAKDAATKEASETEAQKNRAREFKEGVEAALDASKNDESQISSILSKANGLWADVEKFRENYNAFKNSVETVQKEVAENKEEFGTLNKSMSNLLKGIEDLRRNAEEMLGLATYAGLSKNYKDMHDVIDRKIWWSVWYVVASIAFLFLCVVPLGFILYYPVVSMFGYNLDNNMVDVWQGVGRHREDSVWTILYSMATRVVIIVPAILLVGFCISRYNRLFRLKEHYHHKYALAASIEGFKKEAPEYQSEMAAIVFENISFNPAESMDGRRDDRNREEKLMKMLVDKFRAKLAQKPEQ